mmetsp:Transcript_7101/g.9618  ORF Transcript_7101/g.9618 Transcript_7101/m.9618 type:complete len:83 (-) Transcript_7101:63-311(-)
MGVTTARKLVIPWWTCVASLPESPSNGLGLQLSVDMLRMRWDRCRRIAWDDWDWTVRSMLCFFFAVFFVCCCVLIGRLHLSL